MGGLTKAQKRLLTEINETGYVEAGYRFGSSQKNRALWKLESLGLCEFGLGPKGEALQAYGFMPTASGRKAVVK